MVVGKLLFVGVLFCLPLLAFAEGSRASRASEYQLKAAFLFSFAKFIEWPPDTFPDAAAPFRICVLANDPVIAEVQQVIGKKTINGRSVTISSVRTPEEARACHILFLSAAANSKSPAFLKALRGARVLTAGEVPEFCEWGGVVNFIRSGDHIHFELNPRAAEAAGLQVSSRLLRLARVVDHTQPGAQ
jgi:YfiR/HmsC-like